MREFLAKVTGYSDSQLSRLIAQTSASRDGVLAEVDEAFGQPSGPILWRQYHVFGSGFVRVDKGLAYRPPGLRSASSSSATISSATADSASWCMRVLKSSA